MLLILLIAAATWLLSLWLPWWSLALPCLVFGSMLGSGRKSSFLCGFLGVGSLWLIQTSYINWANDGILSARMAELFNMPFPLLTLLATVLIGSLLGGLSTLTGYMFNDAFLSRRISDK
ncbi:MAG: hypothetical protein R3211_03170 [Balneolaceae bacterium]|nr:hypothetical protein [Balneolaceae bacterium]